MADENEYFDVETIILPLEDGTEQECAILDQVTIEGQDYIVLSAIIDDALDDEIDMFKYQEDGEDLIIDTIEDDDEYQRILEIYKDMMVEIDDMVGDEEE